MLPAVNRMRLPDEFRSVSRAGTKAGSRQLVVHCLRTSDDAHAPRVGFVVSKAVGNAVVRNRVKRRLRELMRPRLHHLGNGTLLVIRALPAAADADFAALERALTKGMDRLGLTSEEKRRSRHEALS